MNKNRSIVLAALIIALFMTASCEKIKSTFGEKEVRSQTSDKEGSFEGCFTPGALSQEDAIRYLRILLKGDHNSISFYEQYERTNDRSGVNAWTTYRNDICVTVKALSDNRNPETYDLILRVIKQKKDYPEARVCAIREIMSYGDIVAGKWQGNKESIPVLKKAVKDEHPDVRMNAAAALLSLNKGDMSLPILKEFVETDQARSITALSMLFSPEHRALRGALRVAPSDTLLFDERGKNILIEALNNSSSETRIFAAVRLHGMGIEEKQAEQTAIDVIEKLRERKRKDYEQFIKWQSDRRSLFYAIELLEKVGSKAGIDVLKRYIDNTEDPALKKRAELVLNAIQQK